MEEITITLTLTKDEAWAAAQRIKRTGYSDYRELADCGIVARYMEDADWKLRTALIEAGYAPR